MPDSSSKTIGDQQGSEQTLTDSRPSQPNQQLQEDQFLADELSGIFDQDNTVDDSEKSEKRTSGNDEQTKRRRSSLDSRDRGLPPPSWHNEAADKQHRQSMILEIARLLQARKKAVPSDDWLKQLPHKARKLEGRLYRTSPSLESYLDLGTLKNRLKRLASVITKQHNEPGRRRSSQSWNAINSRVFTAGSSIDSNPSVASAAARVAALHRDSIDSHTSLDSLRSLQAAMNAKSSLGNMGQIESNSRGSSVQSTDSLHIIPEGGESLLQTNVPGSSEQNTMQQAQAQALIQQQAIDGSVDPLSMSTELNAQVNSRSMQFMGGVNPSNVNELERQKAVNERLQQQIMENIQKQEALVQRLKANENSQKGGGLPQQQSMQQPESLNLSNNSGDPNNVYIGVQQGQNFSAALQVQQQQQQQQQQQMMMIQQQTRMPPNMNPFLNGGNQQLPPDLLLAQAALLNYNMNQQGAPTLPQRLSGINFPNVPNNFNGNNNNNHGTMLMGNNQNFGQQSLPGNLVIRQQQQQQQQQQLLQRANPSNHEEILASLQAVQQGNDSRRGSNPNDRPLSPGSFNW